MTGFLLLQHDKRLQVAPDVRILRAAEYAELLEATAVLDRAKALAEQMARDAEAAYAERKEEGYQEGLLAGKMEIAERMMDQMASSLDYLERMETTLVDVVVAAMRKMLDSMDDRERIAAVVGKALSYVRAQKKILLRLNPEEAEFVRAKLDEIMRGHPGIGLVDVTADARLDKGACLLESELGVIDASVEIQLEAIRRSFLRRLSKEQQR